VREGLTVPIRPCPQCDSLTPRRLDGASQAAYVWYYRCDACGHAWSVSKTDEANVHHITPLPPPKL